MVASESPAPPVVQPSSESGMLIMKPITVHNAKQMESCLQIDRYPDF